jgi:hypothetical protein
VILLWFLMGPHCPHQYFENVRNFLVAVQEMGIPTFEASDLEQVCIQESGFSRFLRIISRRRC